MRGLRTALFRMALVAAALFAAYAIAWPNTYYLLFVINLTYFASLVLAWNLVGGYAGQLDLAAAAYMALGGIVASVLTDSWRLNPLLSMLLGGAAAALLAAAVGAPAFRFGVKEVWYALMSATLVVILNNAARLIMGPYEYYLSVRPIASYDQLFLATLLLLVATLLVNYAIAASRAGYYLRAIREDELAAEMIGVDTWKYKMFALVVYAFIVGFSGYLYVALVGYFYTYRFFDSSVALSIALLGIIGGLGSVEGCLASAFVLRGLGEYLRASLGSTIPGLHLLLYGAVLIAVGIFEPEGFAGIARRIWKVIRT
ncbi:MAG: branched-chain amino acid ABC transporter permease [Desulfurococcaceae archaeon]